MKKSFLTGALLTISSILTPTLPGVADTWIARCNGLEFNFDRARTGATDFSGGLIYMDANFPTGLQTIQIANGKIQYVDADSVRAVFNRTGLSGGDFNNNMQIGITRLAGETNQARVVIRHRHSSTGDLTTGTFCNSILEISP